MIGCNSLADQIDSERFAQVAVEAAYGRAVMAAHSLERNLGFLLMTRIVGSERRDVELQLNQIKRLPLGLLISRFVEEFGVGEGLQEELDNMLYFRNELVHRISDKTLCKALDSDWRHRLAQDLIEIEGYFRETNVLLEPYIDSWLSAHDLTRSQLLSIGTEIYKGLARG